MKTNVTSLARKARVKLPQQHIRANDLHLANDEDDTRKDYFKVENGLKFAGTHLILDIWNGKHLDNMEIVEKAMVDSVHAAGATLLHIHLHHFTPNGGISGVAVLSESHISIHSWPERGYAAMDIFMCGDAKPHECIAVLKEAFGGDCTIQLAEHRRGMVG